jgi:hypothetical protein
VTGKVEGPGRARPGPSEVDDQPRRSTLLTIPARADSRVEASRVRAWLALSDERDRWIARLLAAERDAWRRGYLAGYDAGAADAAVELAVMDAKWEARDQWRAWAARNKELLQPADVRLNRALRQVKQDMTFIDQARSKQPWRRSPMEIAVLTGAIFDDPGSAV